MGTSVNYEKMVDYSPENDCPELGKPKKLLVNKIGYPRGALDETLFIEPPPPTAEIVVVHERPYWWHWRSRGRSGHRRGHD